jgi:hypothetical protein
MSGSAPKNVANGGKGAEATTQKQRGKPWQKGQSGNPAGRPKGSRNKLCSHYIDEMHAVFLMAQDETGTMGRAAILAVAQKNPSKFLELIAQLVPKEFDLGDKTAGGFRELWTALGHGKLPAPPQREQEEA